MNRKITLLVFIPALTLGPSACGSSDTGSSSTSAMSSMPMASESSTMIPSAEPTSATITDAAAAVISITDFAYQVSTSVAPGASITIKNGDSQAHTVTSKAGGFDVKVDPTGPRR